MAGTTKKMSKSDFVLKIILLMESTGYVDRDQWSKNAFEYLIDTNAFLEAPNASIFEKDLGKVCFDLENNSPMRDEVNWPNSKDSLLGLHTLENGFSFLGFFGGGDWELPLFFIVYHDGNNFRAYIPNNGNTFNQHFKCAFGSEEECSKFDSFTISPSSRYYNKTGKECAIIALNQQGYIPLDFSLQLSNIGVYPDWDLIKQDIFTRIQIK